MNKAGQIPQNFPEGLWQNITWFDCFYDIGQASACNQMRKYFVFYLRFCVIKEVKENRQ